MPKTIKAKYTIEESTSAVATFFNLITVDSLNDEAVKKEIKKHSHHHYIILKRPRILLENITLLNNAIKYDFIIKGNSDKKLTLEAPVDSEEVKHITAEVTEKGSSFKILKDGKFVSSYKATLLFNDVSRYINKSFPEADYKVLYVGQSYGNKFKRDAYDRLMQHGTLQKILSDTMGKDFNSEIFILFVEYDLNLFYLSMFGAPTKQADIGLEESLNKCTERRSVPIPDKEKITYIEASMIKWFEPEYNTEYKKTFPNNRQSSYYSIYKQDLNNVCFEMDLSNLGIKLYSDKQEPTSIIMGHFALDKKRKDMMMPDIFIE